MDIVDYVTKKVTPITEELSLRFFKAEYVREDNTNIIRVLIDKKGGLDIDDCIAVSERFSAILEKEDPISEDYCLEVTSPGAEREISFDEPLED